MTQGPKCALELGLVPLQCAVDCGFGAWCWCRWSFPLRVFLPDSDVHDSVRFGAWVLVPLQGVAVRVWSVLVLLQGAGQMFVLFGAWVPLRGCCQMSMAVRDLVLV